MVENAEDIIQFKMSSLTWRLILKPEIVFLSLLLILDGFFYCWFKLGYVSLTKATFHLLFYAGLIVNSFLFNEILSINRQARDRSVAKTSPNRDKKKSEAETAAAPDSNDDELKKVLFIRGNIILIWILNLTILIGMSYVVFFQTLLITKLFFIAFFLLLQVFAYKLCDSPEQNEILILIFFAFTGLYLGHYFVSEGSGQSETFRLALPLFFAYLHYVMIRYYILSNKVYTPDAIAIPPEPTAGVDKKSKEATPVLVEPSRFKLERNTFLFLIIILLIHLYYFVLKNLAIYSSISYLSIFSLYWGVNIIIQVFKGEYADRDRLIYMYESSRYIIYWLHFSFVAGLLLEYVLRYRLHLFL